jgi:hypothetical protein
LILTPRQKNTSLWVIQQYSPFNGFPSFRIRSASGPTTEFYLRINERGKLMVSRNIGGGMSRWYIAYDDDTTRRPAPVRP